MPRITIYLDPGITYEVITRPPATLPLGATNQRTGATYAGNGGIAAAIAAAQAGDTIAVSPGVYDSSLYLNRSLSLVSAVPGQRWTVDGGGRNASVIGLAAGVSATIEDAVVRNNKTEWSSLAGIRPEGGTYLLTLRRVLIEECTNGLIAGDHRDGEILLEDCEIRDCGDYNGFTHNLYVGPLKSLTLRRTVSRMTKARADYGSESWRVSWGHLVKSRAVKTIIEDCQLLQEAGEGNRCLDLPNGGDVSVVRTRMVQNANIQNNGYSQALSFGVEESANPMQHTTHRLVVRDCQLVNNGGPNKQILFILTDAQGVPAPTAYDWTGTIFTGYSVPMVKQITGAEGAIYEPGYQAPPVDPPPTPPPPPPPPPPPVTGATVANGVWTPTFNADGTITEAAWADLPLNTMIEWADTALESQLSPPYGAEGTFRDWGLEGVAAHFDDESGAAFDEITGRFWVFGGGHAGSSNNMLTCFDSRTGKWSVAIPPTPIEKMPATYARTGLAAYTVVSYPDGRSADNFPSGWAPSGDGRPTSMHTYGGLQYIKIGGTEYVVKLRGGTGQSDEPGSRYWLANLVAKVWEKGGRMARPGHAVEQCSVVWNGIVYWGAEGGQAADNKYWTISKYDPAARAEVGTFGIANPSGYNVHFSDGGNTTALIAPGKWLVVTNNSRERGFVVLDLATGANERFGKLAGAVPAWTEDDANAGEWIPEIGRVLFHDTKANALVELDPATGQCAAARIVDTNGKKPAVVNGYYGRLRYWPQRKALILHSRTMQAARIVRLG